MKHLAIVALLFAVGCSGSSPTAPSPIVVTPPVVVAPPVTLTPNPLLSDPRFDRAFYQQFVRTPLTRWTQAPRIYLRTVDDGGRAIDPRLLDRTAAAIINTTSAWTGGAFGVAGLEQGIDTRQGQNGWITVVWSNLPNFCGTLIVTAANLGQISSNVIALNHVEPICTCGPLVVKHELGHALGYNHTDSPLDVMTGTPLDGRVCDKDLSARERFHASVAYSMPIGSAAP